MNLGTSQRHAVSVSLIINFQTKMVSPEFHISYDDFFETVRQTVRNPHTYYNCQALTGLRKHKQTTRETKDSAHHKYERPKAVITWEVKILQLMIGRKDSLWRT